MVLNNLGAMEIIIFSVALALGIVAIAEIGAYLWCKLSRDGDPFDMPR